MAIQELSMTEVSVVSGGVTLTSSNAIINTFLKMGAAVVSSSTFQTTVANILSKFGITITWDPAPTPAAA